MQFGVKIRCLHSDRDDKYLSGAFTTHLEAAGTTLLLVVWTPSSSALCMLPLILTIPEIASLLVLFVKLTDPGASAHSLSPICVWCYSYLGV
jgi:hypothetical protein